MEQRLTAWASSTGVTRILTGSASIFTLVKEMNFMVIPNARQVSLTFSLVLHSIKSKATIFSLTVFSVYNIKHYL